MGATVAMHFLKISFDGLHKLSNILWNYFGFSVFPTNQSQYRSYVVLSTWSPPKKSATFSSMACPNNELVSSLTG